MCGSSQSRSALPIRLIASVVRKIASPGNAAIHQEFSMYTRPSPSMLPHAGVGGCTPSPRKDRNDSRTITWATWRVAMTTMGDTRSEEHTSELQSQSNLVCRLLLEKKKKN